MKKHILLVVTLVVMSMVGQAAIAAAQEPPKPEQKPEQKTDSIAGNWIISLESPQGAMQVTMALQQEGTKVTGTLTSQMGETALEGTFEAGKLAFAIAFQGGSGTTEIYFTAELKEDGTLAGVLSGPMGDMPWLAERAK